MQDDHVADLAGQPQVWERFQDRFGLPNGTGDIGYGHTSEQVDALRIEDPALLAEYHHEVTLATARYLQTVDEAELEREVDQRWDPPVTAGQRLVSIQGDCLQHLGQAAYVKGLLRALRYRFRRIPHKRLGRAILGGDDHSERPTAEAPCQQSFQAGR